jgi:hypothetical protein
MIFALVIFNSITLILILALIVLAAYWFARRMGWIFSNRRGRFLPKTAHSASRTARFVEAIVLGIVGFAMIAVAATTTSTGGYMLELDKLAPDYAKVNVIMFVCALAGFGVAVVIALLGRTVAGTITLGIVLIAYGTVLNGPRRAGAWDAPESMLKSAVHYTIDLSGVNVEGAELWVNGVYLGKAPYISTLEEFLSKVPYWPQEPKDYETDKVEIPEYRLDGVSNSIYHRWIRFQVPGKGAEWNFYYARVRYAGEWGLHGGGGGGGMTNSYANSNVDVFFPDRQKRLDALLNKARLADYRVGDDWYKALETYNEDGWLALDNAAVKEPGMKKVMNDWASRRYKLDKVVDEESAWRSFQRICDEAESRQWYLTGSLAGHAVELLVPKLPQDRLVEKAVKIIRNSNTFGYTQWTLNGRLVFGLNKGPGFISLGKAGSSYNYSGTGDGQFPVIGFPVAHAIWKLNDRLVAEKAASPNIIQQRIVPEIIRQYYNTGQDIPMLIAAYFGGPVIDTFLLRQNWNAPSDPPWKDCFYFYGSQVNKWLYLLTYLNDDAGLQFRRKHVDLVMTLADKLCEGPVGGFEQKHIDFIFSEPWLAKEYWPRFAKLVRQKPFFEPLKTQWQYLLKMGDSATAEMFVQAWKETKIDYSEFMFSVPLLKRFDRKTGQKVVDSLVEEIQKHPDNLGNVPENLKKEMIKQLQTPSWEHDPQNVFETLKKGSQPDRDLLVKNLPLWLEQTQPDSPLVAMLAKADDPKLRALALGALQAYPTAEHQALLQQLLKDPDSIVREAAEKVSQELKVLAEADPRQYASDYSSAAEKAPSGK